MDLKTINEMPPGFTPPELTARIVKVWPRKTGTGSDGNDWSYQNVDVEQNGAKATLNLKSLPDFPETRIGQSVIIRAYNSDKFGLTGLKTDSRENNGKTYKSIAVTPTAKWDWGETPTNGSSAPQSTPKTSEGGIEAYTNHLVSCATLANRITTLLGIAEDQSAVQACFATVAIDTKNRQILLPRELPDLNRPDEPNEKEPPPEREKVPEEPPEDFNADDDVPF